jgi:TolB-like protein/tetratricopeptide (TPR) repeat protein
MPTPARSAPETGAVFLSYAREDTASARRIADALRGFGVEVWFDQSELRGGDAWDQKIRGQIKDCALFVPVISAHTESRGEGYFRLEWKLADERTHLMAKGVPFLLPVVVDATRDGEAMVPDSFRAVQWTRLQEGAPTPEFVAQVKRLLAAPKKASVVGRGLPTPPPTRDTSDTAGSGDPALQSRPASRLPVMLGAIAVVAVAAAVYFALRPAGKDVAAPPKRVAPAATAPAVDAKSIAVLPFVNMSGDKDSEYFSDGLTEEILNALARNPALRVAARTSSFAFKGKSTAMDEIGRALHAASVIEGSVRKDGSRVRITVQLINAADGYHVWSETFTKEMTDIFAVQDEIANKVAAKLGGAPAAPAAPGATSDTVATKNLAAYDAYLRGRAAQTSGFSETTSAETVRLYEQAVRVDPDYALAWARLAEVLIRIRDSGYDRSEGVAAKARGAAAAAQRLAPNLPEAHLAQALVVLSVDNDFAAARGELDRVEQLRPNDPDVPAVRARIEYVRGKRDETLAALSLRAVEADPQNVDTLVLMAGYLRSCGRYADAERFCDRAWSLSQAAEDPIRVKVTNLLVWSGDVRAALALLETEPESLRESRFYSRRAELRAQLGDLAGARADYERTCTIIIERYGDRSGPRSVLLSSIYYLAMLDVREGQTARAAARFAEALAQADRNIHDFPDIAPGSWHWRAMIHAAQGRRAEALAALGESVRLAMQGNSMQIMASHARKASVLGLLGDADGAIAELRAQQAAGYLFGYNLRVNSDYEPIRTNPKFQQLMKECEARAAAVPRPGKQK